MSVTNTTAPKESRDLKRYRESASKLCEKIERAKVEIDEALKLLRPTAELIVAHGGEVSERVMKHLGNQ